MSKEDTFEEAGEEVATGRRWLVPMDFSIHANAALEWTYEVMKPNDYLLVLNVLNLKTPTYAHDIALNEHAKREAQEKMDKIAEQCKEKGFKYVKTLSVRGEPQKLICNYAIEDKIDTIVMGRRGMTNMERVLNGSVSSYVLSNASCAVCIMGKSVEEKHHDAKMDKMDKEIQGELSASEEENGEKKMPFFLPRKHSMKNYYTDSD